MDTNPIPLQYRIIVARVPDGWVCVLEPGGFLYDEPATWAQARRSAIQLWHADPETCQMVDVRDPQWKRVQHESNLTILRMIESGLFDM